MALSKATLDAITAAVAAALAAQAPVVGAPASTTVEAPRFVKGKRDKAGNVAGGFPCEVDASCGRVLRYAERAKFHGTEKGHEFRPR
jgi:hypothetical protein